MVQTVLKIKLSITTNAEPAQQTHMFHKTPVFVKMDNNMTLPQIHVPTLSQIAHIMNISMEFSVYAMQVTEDTTANAANVPINLVMINVFAKMANSMILRIIDAPLIVLRTLYGMEILVFVIQDLFSITMSVGNVLSVLLPTKTVTYVYAKIIMFLILPIIDAMLTVHQDMCLTEILVSVPLVLSNSLIPVGNVPVEAQLTPPPILASAKMDSLMTLITIDAMQTVHQDMCLTEILVSVPLVLFNSLIPVDNAPVEAQLTAPQILVFVKMVIHMTLLIIDATLTVVPMKFYLATPVYALETSTDTITYVDNALVVPLLITLKLHAFALSLDKHLI